jgi:hypothetical protein
VGLAGSANIGTWHFCSMLVICNLRRARWHVWRAYVLPGTLPRRHEWCHV